MKKISVLLLLICLAFSGCEKASSQKEEANTETIADATEEVINQNSLETEEIKEVISSETIKPAVTNVEQTENIGTAEIENTTSKETVSAKEADASLEDTKKPAEPAKADPQENKQEETKKEETKKEETKKEETKVEDTKTETPKEEAESVETTEEETEEKTEPPQPQEPEESEHVHQFEPTVFREANCETPKVIWEKCSCGAEGEMYTEGEPLEHDYQGYYVWREPTCKSGGECGSVCTMCGTRKAWSLDTTDDHVFTETVLKEGDCRSPHIVKYKCTVCGYEYTEDDYSYHADDHVWEPVEYEVYDYEQQKMVTKTKEWCAVCKIDKPE